ncbi:MAG: hypothetical protein KG075_22175 [Alphaproteobacteria bacterium]|nr:hypothetical protein [Alphaproteobacteria bacterium]
MPLKRFDNWPALQASFIEQRRSIPIIWGQNDCVLFSLDQVAAITGLDAAADIRGKYNSAMGAARRMKALYGSPDLSVAATKFAARWGGIEIPTAVCGRGDLVLHRSPEGPALGVCVGRQFVSPGENGLVWLPMKLALRGWRV